MIRVSTDKLNKDGMLGIEENGHSVLLVKVGKNYFALGDICPHRKCRLHTGTLKGCPCHGATFDIATGQLQTWFQNFSSDLVKLIGISGLMNIKTYKCTVSGNEIVIDI
ncbi:MAG: Rieske (2Fe-2S) protein [Nitrospirae bacterium YQR-1]